ncbi:aldehyde dehydrogenase family protein [Amycolatopsis sp. cmx-11-32]|uniref:aldehyde dehydrogenase family protein n=1 Tax=Amycolatopsis sp. cmx-11-32 TaxID=2785796 RepID=UPI0039E672A8
MKTIDHWINGAATTAGSTRTAPVHDPAAGRPQAEVLLAEPSDVDIAVTAAGKAFESWGDSSLSQRTRVMFTFRELLVRHEDELAGIISKGRHHAMAAYRRRFPLPDLQLTPRN